MLIYLIVCYIKYTPQIVYCFVELQHARAEDILDVLLDTEVNASVTLTRNDDNRSDTEASNDQNSSDTESRHEHNMLDTKTAESLAVNANLDSLGPDQCHQGQGQSQIRGESALVNMSFSTSNKPQFSGTHAYSSSNSSNQASSQAIPNSPVTSLSNTNNPNRTDSIYHEVKR